MSRDDRTRRIHEAAERWAAEQPELRGRIARAIPMVDRIEAILRRRGPSATYLVRGKTRYYETSERDCTCEDAQGALYSHCKHRIAVALMHASRDGVDDVPTFEQNIRSWAIRDDSDYNSDWLLSNGRAAIEWLIAEVDRLRSTEKSER